MRSFHWTSIVLGVALLCVGQTAAAIGGLPTLPTVNPSDIPPPEYATQKSMNSAQFAAIDALPGFYEVWLDHEGVPSYLKADLGTFGSSSAATDASSLLSLLSVALRFDGTETLVLRDFVSDDTGKLHYRLDQQIGDLPVIGGGVTLHVSSGSIESLDAQFLPGTALLARTPLVPSDVAWAIGKNTVREYIVQSCQVMGGGDFDCGPLLELWDGGVASDPELAFYRDPLAAGYLVWSMTIAYTSADGPQVDIILVDAVTGIVMGRIPQVHGALSRRVYDTHRSFYSKDHTLAMSEGGTTSDPDVLYAYDYSGAAYYYFVNVHSRNSWDGKGASVISRVHHDRTNMCYGGSFWTPPGSYSTTTGDGSHFTDGFNCFAGKEGGDYVYADVAASSRALDIVAHEYVHGVTYSSANLTYLGESGAINESMSDIFGAMVEASVRGLSPATWRFGEDVFTPGTPDDALRYMNDPARDGSTDFYPERKICGSDCRTSTDNGFVHTNSGIGNLAYFLLVNGGSHPRGKTVSTVSSIGGLAKAQRIFYIALTSKLGSSSGFTDLREKTVLTAKDYYGATEKTSVCQAWDAVGVPKGTPACDPPQSPPSGTREECYENDTRYKNYYGRDRCPCRDGCP